MAQAVFLTLQINGQTVNGESEKAGHEDTIECLSLNFGAEVAYDKSSGRLSVPRYPPVAIQKWIDRSSPRILEALTRRLPIEAKINFFRQDQTGREENFYTIEIYDGHIVRVEQSSERNIHNAATDLVTEEVAFIYGRVRWVHEPTGASGEAVTVVDSQPSRSSSTLPTSDSSKTSSDDRVDDRLSPVASDSIRELLSMNRSILRLSELVREGQRSKLDEIEELTRDGSTDIETVISKMRTHSDASEQVMSALSNTLSASHETAKAIIDNMK